MKYTDNLNLKKPDGDEYYDVNDFNDNADIIDETIAEMLNNLNPANNGYGYLPLSGGKLKGIVYFDTVNEGIRKSVDNSYLAFDGGTASSKGAHFILEGKDNPYNGKFILQARNDGGDSELVGTPDGKLTWNGKDIITSAGGIMTTDDALKRNVNVGELDIFGGTCYGDGAHLSLRGKNNSTNKGGFSLTAHNGSTEASLSGLPDGTLTWNDKNVVRSINNINADVNGNVTIPLPSDMTDYIIESYRNGTEWYEVYKSGKVRQGGYKAASSSVVEYTITLLKKYANTDYTVLKTLKSSNTINTAGFGDVGIKSPTTTSFIMRVQNSNLNTGAYWVAEGQGV